jgi:hypothetical protein
VRRDLAPPSGHPPPEHAEAADGRNVALRPLAEEICRRYRAEFPDEQERYGDAGVAWCVHDNQHILNWAFLERRGFVDLAEQVGWLARVLDARDFPLERLVRNLEIAADVVEDGELADALRNARASVQTKEA